MTDKTYYVYSHVDPENGFRQYIGVGCYDRAWACRRSQRNEKHFLWLQEQYSNGFTLADIVKIENNALTKQEALEIENKIIKTEKPPMNELGNPNHWNRGRKYNQELAEFASALHQMGYGYGRITMLMGGTKNKQMTTKRMIQNAN